MTSNARFKTAYDRDGFFFPIDLFSSTEAAGYRALFEEAEASVGDHKDRRRAMFGCGNLALSFVDQISRSPVILNTVSEILGPDLLVWGMDFFVKEPHTDDFVSWHQDLNYWGLDNAREVTVWVALSPATVESGCMRFIPRSHVNDLAEHCDTFEPSNMLTRGQNIVTPVNEGAAINVELKPGQMSLHHGHTFHASHPNRSNNRRIGMAFRYISPDMRQSNAVKTYATLVKGEDRFGHFELAPAPIGNFSDEDMARCRKANALMDEILYSGAENPGKRKKFGVSS